MREYRSDAVEQVGLGDRAVMMLAQRVGALELQVEDSRKQLREAGYLDLVDNDSHAPYVALANAKETQRAREVIAAHESPPDDEDDVALMLEQATAVMAEHEWTDGDRSLPE